MSLGKWSVLIRYRLDQAEHTLRQAAILAEAGEWAGVVNRAYYAMFYAALALLLTKGFGSSKHTGVLALVDREFVRPGFLPAEPAMALRDAFNQRQKYDYGEFVPANEVRAREILENARRFLGAIGSVVDRMEGGEGSGEGSS